MESILTDIKKLSGIEEEYTHFDADMFMHINSAFLTLNQLGVGPSEGFSISTGYEQWSDFLESRQDLESVKIFISLSVRLDFDPPQMGYLVDSIRKRIEEIGWRLSVQAERRNS